MSDYADAKLAIEYRPEIKQLATYVETLPKRFKIRFLELLDKQPDIAATDLEETIESEYRSWKSPYTSAELNAGLQKARDLHPDAEAEYIRVVEKLGSSVDVQSIITHLKERYRSVGTSKDTDQILEKMRELYGVSLDIDLLQAIGIERLANAQGHYYYEFGGQTFDRYEDAVVFEYNRLKRAPNLTQAEETTFQSEPEGEVSLSGLELPVYPGDRISLPINPTVTQLAFDPGTWIYNPVIPWRRYAARIFDITTNGVILWILVSLLAYQVVPYEADQFFSDINPLVDIIFTSLLGCLGSGIILGFTGTTLGKWIFGIRVLTQSGQNIGVGAGITRDLTVWFKGLGMGIPLVSLITLLLAHKSLTSDKTTSWDEGQYCVIHRPSGAFQYFLNVIGIVLFMLISAALRIMEQM